MYDRLSQLLLVLNEITIYACTLIAFSLTDFTYDSIKKYEIGKLWIGIILGTIISDILNLTWTIIWHTKHVLEVYI